MPIKYSKKNRYIHLYNQDISYLIYITPDNGLIHLYFGSHLKDFDLDSMAYNTTNYYSHYHNHKEIFSTNMDFNSETSSMEFPGFGTGDYRSSAVKIKNSNGDSTTDFRYVSHKIFKGKPSLMGLPALYGTEKDFTTLQIKLMDKVTKVEAILEYNIAEKFPIISRNVKITNLSENKIALQHLYSSCLDFKTKDFKLYHLTGHYGKERMVQHNTLQQGIQMISSLEGKSSHNHSPFAALTSFDATEDYGDVYSVNFVYSGNFEIRIDVNQLGFTRLLVGINPETFEYVLNKNEIFQTPEVILLYTDKGLGEMSRIYHRLLNQHLIQQRWHQQKRPLLLNSWEGCFFDFNTDKILKMIDEAHDLGIEMLVIDDGWFGKRNNDSSSLGDWFVNQGKIDLHQIIHHLHQKNMKFGLWFEPEMVCPVSQLFELHPDYAITSKGRPATLMRHQMILDMSRKEVRDNIFHQIAKMLNEYDIDYIKWDHNRSITEAFSKDLDYEHMGEFYHRFILGTYDLLRQLNEKYPNLLIESCCAGGGRYDAGMLFYTPQIWTSDETDALERLTIQEGTSFCFPCSSMGAHVTANPRTNYKTKGNVAMAGTFGYELNPLQLSPKEKDIIKKQIKDYHKYYDLTHYGDLYRIINPSETTYKAAWMFVAKDKTEALFTYVVPFKGPQDICYIKLKGLDENKHYYCHETKKIYSGKFLMRFGLNLTFSDIYSGDSLKYYFKEV